MMIYRIAAVLLTMVVGGLRPSPAAAQSYRDAIQVPPVEVYQSMLNFTDRKEYAKVVSSLNVLSPILNHISGKFKDNPGEMIKKSVEKGVPDEISLSIQNLIIMDMKDVLDEGLQKLDGSPDVSKTQLKIARLNYEVLSQFVQKKDFAADQKIKKNFMDSFRILESESIYSTNKAKTDLDKVRKLWIEIVFSLSKVFSSKTS